MAKGIVEEAVETVKDIAEEVVEAITPAVLGITFVFALLIGLMLHIVHLDSAGRIAIDVGITLMLIEAGVWTYRLRAVSRQRRRLTRG